MQQKSQAGSRQKHRRHFHKAQSRRSKLENDEIAALEAALAEGAPPRGSNPLTSAHAADGQQQPGFAAAKKFDELPISEYSKQGLREAKYVALTAIQRAALPHALCGRDVLGAAKTGSGAPRSRPPSYRWQISACGPCSSVEVPCSPFLLLPVEVPPAPLRNHAGPPIVPIRPFLRAHLCPGKTLAFLLPVMEALYRQRWSKLDGLGALIISPTRELALQVCASMRAACRCRRHRRRCCAAVPSEPQLRVGETCVSCPLLAIVPPKMPGSAPSVLSLALGLPGPALADACAAAQWTGSPHLGAGSHAVP